MGKQKGTTNSGQKDKRDLPEHREEDDEQIGTRSSKRRRKLTTKGAEFQHERTAQEPPSIKMSEGSTTPDIGDDHEEVDAADDHGDNDKGVESLVADEAEMDTSGAADVDEDEESDMESLEEEVTGDTIDHPTLETEAEENKRMVRNENIAPTAEEQSGDMEETTARIDDAVGMVVVDGDHAEVKVVGDGDHAEVKVVGDGDHADKDMECAEEKSKIVVEKIDEEGVERAENIAHTAEAQLEEKEETTAGIDDAEGMVVGDNDHAEVKVVGDGDGDGDHADKDMECAEEESKIAVKKINEKKEIEAADKHNEEKGEAEKTLGEDQGDQNVGEGGGSTEKSNAMETKSVEVEVEKEKTKSEDTESKQDVATKAVPGKEMDMFDIALGTAEIQGEEDPDRSVDADDSMEITEDQEDEEKEEEADGGLTESEHIPEDQSRGSQTKPDDGTNGDLEDSGDEDLMIDLDKEDPFDRMEDGELLDDYVASQDGGDSKENDTTKESQGNTTSDPQKDKKATTRKRIKKRVQKQKDQAKLSFEPSIEEYMDDMNKLLDYNTVFVFPMRYRELRRDSLQDAMDDALHVQMCLSGNRQHDKDGYIELQFANHLTTKDHVEALCAEFGDQRVTNICPTDDKCVDVSETVGYLTRMPNPEERAPLILAVIGTPEGMTTSRLAEAFPGANNVHIPKSFVSYTDRRYAYVEMPTPEDVEILLNTTVKFGETECRLIRPNSLPPPESVLELLTNASQETKKYLDRNEPIPPVWKKDLETLVRYGVHYTLVDNLDAFSIETFKNLIGVLWKRCQKVTNEKAADADKKPVGSLPKKKKVPTATLR